MTLLMHRVSWSAVLLIVWLGTGLDVMEVDAAQYAEMSRQLAADGDWLHFHWRGHDYLDKPPLLFWLSALSFKLFSVHNWSYKLPSVLFAFAGVLAVFRLVRRTHPVDVARTAAFMFATTAAFTLMTNDVRCDTILTACIVIAIQQGDAYQNGRAWKHLLGCAVAIALAMLAKGPIGLVAPLLALLPPLVIARRWRSLFDPRALVVPLVLAVLLLPMCIGLYEQHGAHGIRFYFWEQSFGRITGENRWKDDSSPLYFLHEVPWLLLPWTLLAVLGLWHDLAAWMRNGRAALPDATAVCGALGIIVVMSLSRYKLPHYVFPAVPLLCVLAARALHAGAPRWAVMAQNTIAVVLVLAAGVLALAISTGGGAIAWLLAALLALLVVIVSWVRVKGALRVSAPGAAAAVFGGLVLNAGLYPFLLKYQSNAQAGHLIEQLGIDPRKVAGFRNGGAALDFYVGAEVPWFDAATDVLPFTGTGCAVFTDPQGMRELQGIAPHPQRVETFRDHPAQRIDPGLFSVDQRALILHDRQRVLLIY